MNVAASNMANADSAVGSDGQPYRARQVVFQVNPSQGQATGAEIGGVRVAGIVAGPRAHEAPVRPHQSAGRQPGLRQHAQRRSGGRNGEHDLGIALLPGQRRSAEHRQDLDAEDA